MSKEQLEELKKAFDELDSSYVDLQEQNKRYREALEKIKKEEAVTTALSEGQVAYTFSGHIARKALEKNTMTDKEQIEDIKRKLEKDSRDSINRWWDKQ